jgi:hypothetical protein
MNVTKTISIVMLTAAMSWAQATTATAKKTTVKNGAAAKPASQMAPKSAKTAPMPKAAAKPAPMKSSAPATAKKSTMQKPAPMATAKAAKPAKPAKQVKTATKAAAKPAAETPAQRAESLTKPIGKRDPFVSVIVARGESSAACAGGKRCLVIDQLALRGIVRTPSKWIALVENPAKKTYYLYENDPIFNAVVVRITGDSVIFRESVMDALGHSTEREVVKRVSAPAI